MRRQNKFVLWGILFSCFVLAAVDSIFAADTLKALILDGQNNHNWAETSPVLKEIMEDSGYFSVDVATSPAAGQDMSSYKPQFKNYDVVVINYNGDDWPEETRQAFLDYVENGGGVVVYHAGNNAFPNWKEFNEITGLGGWGNRNEKNGPYYFIDKEGKIVLDAETPGIGGDHGPQWAFLIDVRQPEHPIMKGLPLEFRHCEDELYQHLRGPAKNIEILATAYADPSKGGTDRFEPMLFTISYGKGRIFHTALGHAGKQCRSVSFIITFLRGAEWAATGNVTIPVPDDMPGTEEPVYRP